MYVIVMQDCERPCFSKLGKSVVAACHLKKGQTVERVHLKIKISNEHGYCAHKVHELYGKILERDVSEDEPVTAQHFC